MRIRRSKLGIVGLGIAFLLHLSTPALSFSFFSPHGLQTTKLSGVFFQQGLCLNRHQRLCPVYMSTPESGEEKKVLGSRTLHRVKEVLKTDPSNLDSSSKLLGSRRLAAATKAIKKPQQENASIVSAVKSASQESPTQSITMDTSEMKGDARNTTEKESAELQSKMESVEKTTEVGATVEECFAVASGYEDYPKWAASVAKVSVLGREAGGLGKQVEFSVGAFGTTLDYTLEYEYDAPRQIRWKAVAGSVKALMGSYTFEAMGGGKTRVVYKLAIDPGFYIPRMVKQGSTKLIVSTALNELRKYAEKQHSSGILFSEKTGSVGSAAKNLITSGQEGKTLSEDIRADGRSLLGSKRLRRVKDALDSDPLSAGSTDKVLGSRRLSQAKKALKDNQTPEAASTIDVNTLPLVKAKIEIDASVDECFAAASRLADYPKWSASVQSSRVLQLNDQNLAEKVEFCVTTYGKKMPYTARYEYDAPRQIRWKAVAGSVKALVGSYTFKAMGGGKTQVRYTLAIDPGFTIPSLVRKCSTKAIVNTALKELRKYTQESVRGSGVVVQASDGDGMYSGGESDSDEDSEANSKSLVYVEKAINVRAAVETCFGVASEFEKYPAWAGIQGCSVLSQDGDAEALAGSTAVVELKMGALGYQLKFVLDYNLYAPELVSWSSRKSDNGELQGSYQFQAAEDGGTLVRYMLALDLPMDVPSFVRDMVANTIASNALKGLKRQAEKS